MADLHTGEVAPRALRFCPYAAVTKWPYKYLHGEVRRVVSDNYFAFGLFKTLGWHIYYIRTLLDTAEKPLLLVREDEVQRLFDTIAEELDIHVAFPNVMDEPGFQLEFAEEGSPRPRYLGRLTEENDVATLENMIPAEGSGAEVPDQLDERSFPMFRRYMQLALEASKQKSKAVRDKRKLERIDAKKKRCAELKRTQCYLGFRKRGTAIEESFMTGPNMSYEDTLKAREAHEVAAGVKIPILDTSQPASWPCHNTPIFICVDIEVWERDHRKLTEIGVCTLDTQDLTGTPPRVKGSEWTKLLRCRHFRVRENAHMTNVEFVAGCADRFEFGQSEWISVKDIPQVLASCFKAPFSEPGKYTPFATEPKQCSDQLSDHLHINQQPPGEKRNIILVGHETGSDIGYMRSAGYDVGNLPNLIEAIDTTVLFRALKHEQNPRNLGAVLLDLGLTGWNLHNAGNDAAYTMQALIAITVTSLSPDHIHPAEPSAEEIESAEASSRERIREDYEEWSLAEAEGGDGGNPIAVIPWSEAQEKAAWEKGMKTADRAEQKREKRNARSDARAGGRGRRGGGYRGGGSVARGGGDVPGKKREPEVRSLDMDAMDEAMGFDGPSNRSGSSNKAPASMTEFASTAAPESVETQSSRAPSTAQSHPQYTGYLPPHVRRLQGSKVAGDGEKAAGVSDRMAARLKMMGMDG